MGVNPLVGPEGAVQLVESTCGGVMILVMGVADEPTMASLPVSPIFWLLACGYLHPGHACWQQEMCKWVSRYLLRVP